MPYSNIFCVKSQPLLRVAFFSPQKVKTDSRDICANPFAPVKNFPYCHLKELSNTVRHTACTGIMCRQNNRPYRSFQTARLSDRGGD